MISFMDCEKSRTSFGNLYKGMESDEFDKYMGNQTQIPQNPEE